MPRSLHPGMHGGASALFVNNKVTGEVRWYSDLEKERTVHSWVRTVDNVAGLAAMTVSSVIRSYKVGRVGPYFWEFRRFEEHLRLEHLTRGERFRWTTKLLARLSERMDAVLGVGHWQRNVNSLRLSGATVSDTTPPRASPVYGRAALCADPPVRCPSTN